MDPVEALTKLTAAGFAAGFMTRDVPKLGADLWPLVGLLLCVAAVMLLLEVSGLEPVRQAARRKGLSR